MRLSWKRALMDLSIPVRCPSDLPGYTFVPAMPFLKDHTITRFRLCRFIVSQDGN